MAWVMVLGAVSTLSAGVVRDRVGDVLVQGEAGAQILVDPELVEHFTITLTKVRIFFTTLHQSSPLIAVLEVA